MHPLQIVLERPDDPFHRLAATDLGTLAGLNAYGHDWLRGKRIEVYWESQQYGFSHI